MIRESSGRESAHGDFSMSEMREKFDKNIVLVIKYGLMLSSIFSPAFVQIGCI